MDQHTERAHLGRHLLLLGAVMLPVGLAVFIAANWSGLSGHTKMALILGLFALANVGAVYQRPHTLAGRVWLMVAGLLIGPALALHGQVYQTGADAWTLFAGWAALLVPYVWLSRFWGMYVLWWSLVHIAVAFFHEQWLVADTAWFGTLFAFLVGAANAMGYAGARLVRRGGRRVSPVVFVFHMVVAYGAWLAPTLALIFDGMHGLEALSAAALVAALVGMVALNKHKDTPAIAVTGLAGAIGLTALCGRVLLSDLEFGAIMVFGFILFGIVLGYVRFVLAFRAQTAPSPETAAAPGDVLAALDAAAVQQDAAHSSMEARAGSDAFSPADAGAAWRDEAPDAPHPSDAAGADPALPWYAHVFAALGVWLASVFIVVPLAVMFEEAGLVLVGGPAYVAGLVMSRSPRDGHTFADAFYGQVTALLVIGGTVALATWVGLEVRDEWVVFLVIAMLSAGASAAARMPFLAFVGAGAAVLNLLVLVAAEATSAAAYALIPFAIAMLASFAFVPGALSAVWRARRYGLAVATMVALGFSTVARLDKGAAGAAAAGLPALSLALGIAAGVYAWTRRAELGGAAHRKALVVLGVVLFALSWQTPALFFAALCVALAFEQRNWLHSAAALALLGVSVWLFYLTLEVPLLYKSTSLMAAGAALLVWRALLLAGTEKQSRQTQLGRGIVPIGAACALVVAFVVGISVHKEWVLATGDRVVLQLAPRDPRSILQGDYMTLQYRMADKLAGTTATDGYLVVTRDADDRATFVRVQPEVSPLGPGESALRYRRREHAWSRRGLRIGAESYLFEEGRDKHFAKARFGVLRVRGSHTVLSGLLDAELNPL